MVCQDFRAHRGPDARSGDVVLDADGDAMQRSAILAPHQSRFLLPGLLPGRVMQDGNERIQARLQPFGLRQSGLGEFHRRDLARPDFRGKFSNAQGEEFCRSHLGLPSFLDTQQTAREYR